MLRASGGLRCWPRGVIQSKMDPFKLFVSSALALEEPFCIYRRFRSKSFCESEYDLRVRQCALLFRLIHPIDAPLSQVSSSEAA
jgi:hypothetical protein